MMPARIFYIVILALSIAVSPAMAQWSWSNAKEKMQVFKKKAASAYEASQYAVPVTGRRFFNAIPNDVLLNISERQYSMELQHYREIKTSSRLAQLKRVTKRLENAVNRLYARQKRTKELKFFHWEYHLVDDANANASCMYGGKILVNSGILSVANDDASLAIVLGHEIAHALAKHSAEQITNGIVTTAGMTIVYSVISNSDISERKKILARLMATAGVTLANLKYSRLNETEADHIGIILAAMAGYDPRVAIGFWQRMESKSRFKTTHDWFSTHPSNANRIQNIKSFIPEAKKYQMKIY